MNPIKTTPKDFFLHLGIIIFLYVSSISLLSLVFSTINKAFPDKLAYYYMSDPYSSGMRFAIASLIIIFPLTLLLSFFVNRDMKENPAKAELSVRKWLTYLTLFLTGIALVVDLVVLINTFLGGEITVRFILKVISILIVIGFIFGYYLFDLKKSGGAYRKISAIAASVIVLAAIIGGFAIMGSPATARAVRFDMARVNDLEMIQSQIINIYQQKGALPQTLSELSNTLSGYQTPKDPETDAPYTYTATGPLSFKLCATFTKPTSKEESLISPYTNESWKHGEGNVCFERSIDPLLYPVRTTTKALPPPAPVR